MASYNLWKTTDIETGIDYISDIYIYDVKHCEAVEVVDDLKNIANEVDRISLEYQNDKRVVTLSVALLSKKGLDCVVRTIHRTIANINGRKKWTPYFH